MPFVVNLHVKLEYKPKMNSESLNNSPRKLMRHGFMSMIFAFVLSVGFAFAFPIETIAQEKGTAAQEIAEDKQKTDSVKLIELTLQLEEMKLNEILLKSQLEENNQQHIADSLKKAGR